MIKEHITYETPDGMRHATKEMANHWLVLQEMNKVLDEHHIVEATDNNQITEWIWNNRRLVEQYIDATQKMTNRGLSSE